MTRILGLDLGIASIGWAVVDLPDRDGDDGQIAGCGVWLFNSPENADGNTKAQDWAGQRRVRRLLNRRRQRMQRLRELFYQHGLLEHARKDALALSDLDRWRLRAEALDQTLTGPQLAAVLGHIARHRGFRPAKGSEGKNDAADEKGKIKKALAENQQRMAEYTTAGQMVAMHDDFLKRKRNRSGDYKGTLKRPDLLNEAKIIFERQRKRGNKFTSVELEQAFLDIAFWEKGPEDSWNKVGDCLFEKQEKRTSKRAYSFEKFRLLTRLATLRIEEAEITRALAPDEIARIAGDFGNTASLSFATARKLAGLSDAASFQGVPRDQEGKKGVVSVRNGDFAAGSYRLRKVLGESPWQSLVRTPEKLDRIAEELSFCNREETLRKNLESLDLEPLIIETLVKNWNEGEFDRFTGSGNLSGKAVRALIPHLIQGLDYTKACEAAGYNHAAQREQPEPKDIPNPTVRKAVIETLKQIKVIVQEFGEPDLIHVEVARDIGKSKDERDEITRGLEKRTKERERNRQEAAEILLTSVEKISDEELLRYELAKEQGWFCLYTGKYIDENIKKEAIRNRNNLFQIDHILPESRFGENSYHNLTLCFSHANQQKQNRTPFEWFSADKSQEDWECFKRRVESNKTIKGIKKRNFMLKDAQSAENRFKRRNLQDTREIATKMSYYIRNSFDSNGKFLDILKNFKTINDHEKKLLRVFCLPGAMTDMVRKAWGLDSMKYEKDDRGTRIRKKDDRNHAIDAIIVATLDGSDRLRLTKQSQEIYLERKRKREKETIDMLFDAWRQQELSGFRTDSRIPSLSPPWSAFEDNVKSLHKDIFVARAENRRARGQAHDATIKSLKIRDDAPVIFERKSIHAREFKEVDLDRVKDPERNEKIIEAVRGWIHAGRPKDTPPLSPRGDVIQKLTLQSRDKPAVSVRGGNAQRGCMVRVDVFRHTTAKGKKQFFMVPVYVHEVATLETPPNRVITGGKQEDQWPVIDLLQKSVLGDYDMGFDAFWVCLRLRSRL